MFYLINKILKYIIKVYIIKDLFNYIDFANLLISSKNLNNINDIEHNFIVYIANSIID
jgi:hypothetical protein